MAVQQEGSAKLTGCPGNGKDSICQITIQRFPPHVFGSFR
jgi:hypothetical protein